MSGEVWWWRTIARMPDRDHLELLAFNIAPSGAEDRALHTTLVRLSR